jgi:hypothetical protein
MGAAYRERQTEKDTLMPNDAEHHEEWRARFQVVGRAQAARQCLDLFGRDCGIRTRDPVNPMLTTPVTLNRS